MGTDVKIQSEDKTQHKDIDRLLSAAFGSHSEAELVHAIRKTEDYISDLSLVAVCGDVVGYALFSQITIINDEGEKQSCLALAPMAVAKNFQNRGIGSELVQAGLNKAREMGFRLVFVVGYPKYYSRFGFVSASEQGFNHDLDLDIPDEAFMVCDLTPEKRDHLTGTIQYPPAFAAVS